MDHEKQTSVEDGKTIACQSEPPRALAYSESGITTGADFANVMSALISDLIAGRVTPQVGNAVCNVGGKLLKVVEMQHRYGTSGDVMSPKTITLASPRLIKSA